MIWKHPLPLEQLNAVSERTLNTALGIEFTEIGPDFIQAKMPVNEHTVQPFRILHGGASAALAETLGSVASLMCLDDPTTHAGVGVELNCSHLRGVPEGGMVIGTAKPYRLGKKIQVWNMEIHNEQGELVCVSRLTIAVVEQKR
ncbi:MAG: hotdog fold thioesterase [Haliscomenobacter sp.]|nr:hotdog fold thioesterase [Haliscomenobacter sp.]MBK8656589.1 hotdog fold thioesterase [Haliscomenobacter sp.]